MVSYDDLLKGYQKTFQIDRALYQRLSTGQNPSAMIITCSDSRVDPALFLRCQPGEIFVLRNIANLIPAYRKDNQTDSSVGSFLRYGVYHLKIPHLILMGHSHCGGIRARLESLKSGTTEEYISSWLEWANPFAEKVIDQCSERSISEQAVICEQENIVFGLNQLLTYPWIQERVNRGELTLHGWYFELETAILKEWSFDQKVFKPINVMM